MKKLLLLLAIIMLFCSCNAHAWDFRSGWKSNYTATSSVTAGSITAGSIFPDNGLAPALLGKNAAGDKLVSSGATYNSITVFSTQANYWNVKDVVGVFSDGGN